MTEKILALAPTSAPDDWNEYELFDTGYKFRIFKSINELPTDWEAAQPPHNTYLHRPILSTIEEAPPKGITPCYLVFYKNISPVGVAYCQVTNFKTDQNVQDKDGSKEKPALLKSITSSVKGYLARQFEYNLLVCGNLLFTGEHGFYFDKNIVTRSVSISLLEEAMEKTQQFWKKNDLKIDGVFIKDLEEKPSDNGHYDFKKDLADRKYREFLFHPNMVLSIRPNWKTFDDYMDDISSKYKVRARKAFKCGILLEKIELTEEDLKKNVDRLYDLYKGVMLNAGFNMVVLHENYIVKLKENLGNDFRVTGYYLDRELIGYRTNITNFGEMEAHFLGYDQRYNKSHQLYMNMLLDCLKLGIEKQVERIVFARTAMEIKSTIGAIPENMFCYIRANNKLMNSMMAPILEYFRPEDKWVQRNPFKAPIQ